MDNKPTIQQQRYSDAEKSLLRATFKNREDILLAIRNLFLGFDVDSIDKEFIEKINTPAIYRILRKLFLPELQKDIPIGLERDMWMTVQIQSYEEVQVQAQAREVLIQMLEQALALINDINGVKPDLSIPPPDSPYFHSQLIARNNFISMVEINLVTLRQIANEKEETPEETVARKKKDSMK